MKASNTLLAVWLLVVGGLVFLAVHVLLQDPDRPNQGAANNGGENTPVDVPEAPDGNGARRQPPRTPPKRETASIQGRVLGPEGEAVEGARVTVVIPTEAPPPKETARTDDIRFINSVVYVDPEDWDRPRPLNEWSAATGEGADAVPRGLQVAATESDAEGNFRVDLPRPAGLGPFRLTAEKDGVGRSSAQGVRAGATIELTLGVASKLTGLVLGGESGVGVPSAAVAFYDGETRFRATTKADGRFEIEGIGTGIYEVTITAKDHPPLLREQIEVQRNADVELRLPRGATVRVTAMLEPLEMEDTEQPLSGVQIVLMEEATLAYVIGVTGANGVAEFHGLPPGEYIVNGRGAQAISFGEEQAILEEGDLLEEVVLSMEPAVLTPVIVKDEAGDPLAGVRFFSGSQDEEYDALRSEELPGESGTDGKYEFAFEFEGPRATIFGFKKGYAMIRVYPLDHDTGDPYEVTAYKALRVHGRVTTPDGTPVPDAIVSIEIVPELSDEVDDVLIQVRTGPDGSYDFPYVAKGDVWVFAETDDGWSEEFELEYVEGKSDYRIDLELEID